MQLSLYILIILFGLSSYFFGIRQMLKGQYSPSTFSRVIWVLLATNSFAGLVLSGGSKPSILLGAIFLLGNIAICFVSFWKGTRFMGKLEYVCLSLLFISALIWIFFNAPFVNLVISLFAHFIGALPTIKRVWAEPKNESVGFWSLFFFASLLSIFATKSVTLSSIIFPLYFVIFDGGMTVLAMRKKAYRRS